MDWIVGRLLLEDGCWIVGGLLLNYYWIVVGGLLVPLPVHGTVRYATYCTGIFYKRS